MMCKWMSDFSRLSMFQVLTKKEIQSISMIQHFKKWRCHCDKKRIAHHQWRDKLNSQNQSFKSTSFKSFQIDRSWQQKFMKNELKKSKQNYESSVIKRIYLWLSVKQREREIFIKKHASVIKNCLLYIQAWILSNWVSNRLITSSWVLEFKSSIQLEKCWVKLNFFWKSVELSWEVELKHLNRVEKLNSSTWIELRSLIR